MLDPVTNSALAAAQAAAAAGTAAAELGYALTTRAVEESDAVAVFPLLAVELAAIAGGLAAYAATDVAATAAEATATAAAAAAAAEWGSLSR